MFNNISDDNTKGNKKKMVNVQEAQFPRFDINDNDKVVLEENDVRKHMGLLMDVPVNIRVEIGRTRKTMSEIMQLAQGSVIKLNKQAGSPVEVIANNQSIAKGDVVVIDDRYGVRLTEISSHKIISVGK